MSAFLRRSILAGSVAALAATGLLAGCQKVTTTQSPDRTTTTITTTTVIPTEPSASATAAMKSAAREVGSEASAVMTKAGDALEDGVITTKVKTALLADPDVKGLRIDVDTKAGVVTEDRLFKRPFSFPMAPRTRQSTALGALESVFGGGCGLLGVDSAAENRPSRAPFAGYPWSPGHFHRSRKPSDAADSSGPGCWVA